MTKPTLYLVGPTASGKSAVALALSPRLNAEIVSADSMQVYRGMDIGTAKPTRKEQERVRHHLIDVAELSELFDVARYRELAQAAIVDIRARGKTPLVVGGSGMYLRALREGIFAGPSANAELRARLERLSAAELHARLAKLDSVAAKKIGARNQRRVIRALEVIKLTGKLFSAQQTQWRAAPSPMIGLAREREDLYRRIEARVEAMFAAGFVDEVCALLKRGLAENRTAMQAAGYKEVTACLRGDLSLDEARELTKRRTRQLAKRQLTWFRHQATVHWVDVKPDESIESIVERAQKALAL